MKGWSKKMIWFFGSFFLINLDDYLNPMVDGRFPEDVLLMTALTKLLVIVIPLFFLGDDEK